MNRNVGSIDRILRLVAGVMLLVLPFAAGLPAFDSTLLTGASLAVGVVLISTALFKFCPMYRILGIRTCSVQAP